MFINAVAILIVLLSGYVWLTRGFFSGLLNLICTVVAGAIALALWEPVAYAMLNSQASGWGLVSSISWGVSLGLVFAVSLLVLRLIVDGVVRANVKIPQAADYVGGGITGVCSGIIVSGMVCMSIGFMRNETDFLGYSLVEQGPAGGVVRTGGLWVPTDRMTVAFYEATSLGVFSTGTPLATLSPRVHEVSTAMRMTDGAGENRSTYSPKDFTVTSRYVLEVPGVKRLEEMLNDTWGQRFNTGPQRVEDLNGEPMPNDSRLMGFVVTFTSGAKEKFGQVVISNPNIWLVANNAETGESMRLHPIAVAAASQAVNETSADRRPIYGRFRFDTRAGLHVASVGGASDSPMAFEFVVPRGYEPAFLYVRNIRSDVTTLPEPTKFGSIYQRDESIKSGAIFSGGAAKVELDKQDVVVLGDRRRRVPGAQVTFPPSVLMSNGIGFTIMRGTHDPLDIDDENKIVNGIKKFDTTQLRESGSKADRALRIERFAGTEDTLLVQLNVSSDQEVSLLSRWVQAQDPRTAPPRLVDSAGTSYEAIGYIYEARDITTVRFTPGQPLQGLAEMEALSLSRSDQKLRLIFRVSLNAEIQYFAVGNKAIVEYNPTLPANVPQR
ncbi:MAG: CvpA family protein [Planctomycetota bacterium]|nr:CvpA family protein [Planctomycetota bacterium]